MRRGWTERAGRALALAALWIAAPALAPEALAKRDPRAAVSPPSSTSSAKPRAAEARRGAAPVSRAQPAASRRDRRGAAAEARRDPRPRAARHAAATARSKSARHAAARPAAPPPPPAPSPEETRAAIGLALQTAQEATGLDAATLHRIAEKESRLDPLARSRLSSATGLMQFTRATWLEAVRDHGPRHGLEGAASSLRTDREGRVSARDGRELRRVLGLRRDPRHAALLAAERMRAARAGLERALGRPAGPQDLYLVHLLGEAGAHRFLAALRASPARSSHEVLGVGARNNPSVFGRPAAPLSVAASYAGLARLFGEPEPVQLASFRPGAAAP